MQVGTRCSHWGVITPEEGFCSVVPECFGFNLIGVYLPHSLLGEDSSP